MSSLAHPGFRRRIVLWLSPWCALLSVLTPAQAGSLEWRDIPPSSAQQQQHRLPWQPVLQKGPSAPTQPSGSPGMAWQPVPALPPLPGSPAEAAPNGLAWRPVAPGEQLVVTAADASPNLAAGQPDRADPPEATPPRPRPNLATPTETDPTAGGQRIASPYIGGGLPSAYNASGGDYFIAGTAGTPGKLRDGVPDGSVNIGFGIGNPFDFVSLEVDLGIGSIKNFAYNGGLDASISRVLVTQPRFELAIGGGYLGFFSYGNEGTDTPNGYGVATLSTVLNYGNVDFPQVLQFSAGFGGNTFAYLDPETYTGPSTSWFAALGVELTPRIGVSIGWSGRGSNASLSYVPFPRSLPVSINLTASDVTNNSPFGTVGLLTVSWGGNFFRDLWYDIE